MTGVPSRVVAAYHEAGHVVGCAYYRVPVSRVTIDPTLARALVGEERAGACEHQAVLKVTSTGRVVNEFAGAVIALAGPAAQARLVGERAGAPGPDDTDLGRVVEFTGDDERAARSVARTAAWIIEHRWPEIVRVAEGLLNRATLTEAEVNALLGVAPRLPVGTAHRSVGPPLPGDQVRVMVLDAAGRLLLLQRSDDARTWEPVHGTMDDADARAAGDRTPRDTAEREFGEETGWGSAIATWCAVGPHTWIAQLPAGAGDPVISHEHVAWRWASGPEAYRWLEA